MQQLRSAIIGCGKMAQVHAQALKNIPETELVAVQSRSAEKAAATGLRFGAKPYTDIEKMIRHEKIDVVVVCTPHPAHCEPTVIAMQNGAHVLTEKPLAVSLPDCDT